MGSTPAAPVSAAGTGTLSTAHSRAAYKVATICKRAASSSAWRSTRNPSHRVALDPSRLRAPATFVTSFDTDWLITAKEQGGTVRLRPTLLGYATTGFALTDLSVGNSVTGIGTASARGLVTGRVIGAGAEFAFSRDWTVRGEYLFLNFGSTTVNTPTTHTYAPTISTQSEPRPT